VRIVRGNLCALSGAEAGNPGRTFRWPFSRGNSLRTLSLALPHVGQRALRRLLLAYVTSVVSTVVILMVLSESEPGFHCASLSLL
jgi:hypothetical protein